MAKTRRQIQVYLSSIIVAVAVFLPLASIPLYGDISYNRIAAIESWLIVALAISTPVLILLDKSGLTVLPMLGIWLTLLFPLLQDQMTGTKQNGLLTGLMDAAADPLRKFAVDIFMNISDYRWGGYLFMAGLLVLTVSSMMLFVKSR